MVRRQITAIQKRVKSVPSIHWFILFLLATPICGAIAFSVMPPPEQVDSKEEVQKEDVAQVVSPADWRPFRGREATDLDYVPSERLIPPIEDAQPPKPL